MYVYGAMQVARNSARTRIISCNFGLLCASRRLWAAGAKNDPGLLYWAVRATIEAQNEFHTCALQNTRDDFLSLESWTGDWKFDTLGM